MTAVAVLGALLVVAAPPPADAAPVTLALYVDSVIEIDDPESGIGEGDCWGDYEISVTIGGVTSTSREFSIDPGFGGGCLIGRPVTLATPFDVTGTVESDDPIIPITIKVVDVDTFNDDTIDVNPEPGVKSASFTIVDLSEGTIQRLDSSGNPTGPVLPGNQRFTMEGDGDDVRGAVNFYLGIDSDGDGLFDSWETNGVDTNGDGSPDLRLDLFGADPMRADLFVELDTANGQTLARDDIQAMKNAFAAAPILNPDGSTGINLWVDTGTQIDPNASEGDQLGTCNDGFDNGFDGTTDANDPDCVPGGLLSGGFYLDSTVEDPGPANCGDGFDNDGDGLADAADPDCLVGDNLGGGTAIAGTNPICNLGGAFYNLKRANFDFSRATVFRYGISSPGTSCSSGGQAEIGGNDFVDHNGDGGTIMHELGHTLTLRHGGNENDNCKPNHVSVMNYFNQFGIGRVGGGTILDYAPVRSGVTSGPRSATITTSQLRENALDETAPVDPADATNNFVFTDGTGLTQWQPLGAQIDWDGDGTPLEPSVRANIDDADAMSGQPRACDNSSSDGVHDGADEWSQVSLPFRQFGDSLDAPLNPTTEPEPTREEIEQLIAGLTGADLSVSLSAVPDPTIAGTGVEVTATVSNGGAADATASVLSLALDPALTLTTLPSGCVQMPPQLLCSLGVVTTARPTTIVLDLVVASGVVHDAGAPTTVVVAGSVEHAGADPDPNNDETEVTVNVVAEADLSLGALGVSDAPPILIVGEATSISVATEARSSGPSSPMDAVVDYTATSIGVAVGAPPAEAIAALAVDARVDLNATFEVTCLEPGLRTIELGATISPARPDDVDPNETNDGAVTTIEIDCALRAAVDVDPGQADDELRRNNNGNVFIGVFSTGVGEYGLPVAIDATAIDDESLRIGTFADLVSGGGVAPRFVDEKNLQELGPREKSRDGDVDKRIRVVGSEVEIDADATELCVIGTIAYEGTTVTIVGCGPVTVI